MKAARVVPTALLLLLVGGASVRAQEGPELALRGMVVSAEGQEVVAGAWVALEGQQWGTFSWNDGHFFLPEVPSGPRAFEVTALGYEPAVVMLDPATADLTVELTPDAEMQLGLASLMDQLQRRRNRGGDLRVFDREALAFNGSFALGDYLADRGVRGVRLVCLDERPATLGILEREGHQFYLVETFGRMLRVYTEDFIERAARERLQLQREPTFCSGPVS